MSLLSTISALKNAFLPPVPTLEQAAVGLCALPTPAPRREVPKQPKQADMYVIDQSKNEYGFHSATATRQAEGSVSTLTSFDIELLMDRGYWGKGKDVQAKNARCKAMWHSGATDKEIAASLGVGESWVEKRAGTFTTALLQEGSG